MLRAIPFGWLLAFVAVPCLLLLAIAFSSSAEGVPPFAWGTLSLDAWATLTEDSFYLSAFLRSLRVAFITAALCLALAFPMALALARAPARWQPALVLAVLLPFWTGFLLRVCLMMLFAVCCLTNVEVYPTLEHSVLCRHINLLPPVPIRMTLQSI